MYMVKTFICSNCSIEGRKHRAKGLCDKCYHAQYERDQRKLGNRKAYERKRSKTKKRRKWKREYSQKYYKENRERLIVYQREYRRKNKEKIREADKIRKRKIRAMSDGLTTRQWYDILVSHEWKCYYCKKEQDNPEQEHTIPVSRGGGTDQNNIVPACHRCNCRKNNRTVEEYREFLIEIGETPLF